jgi:hypothetical protein
MTRPIFRSPPQLPAHAMKTYSIVSPIATHWRKATCAEVNCPAHNAGWSTSIDERTDLGQGQAYYIRKQSGRRFTETKDAEWSPTVFTFPAGQTCFRSAEHRLPLERPALYYVTGGDWRGNPRGTQMRHRSGDDWVDDFAGHQQRLADRLGQG